MSLIANMTGVSYRIIMHANNFHLHPFGSILLLFIIESEEIFSKLAKKGEVGSDEYYLRSLEKKYQVRIYYIAVFPRSLYHAYSDYLQIASNLCSLQSFSC